MTYQVAMEQKLCEHSQPAHYFMREVGSEEKMCELHRTHEHPVRTETRVLRSAPEQQWAKIKLEMARIH